MKQYIYTFVFVLVALNFNEISAQVTVGAHIPPESFSALQVEVKGGLRLPRISDADKPALNVSSSVDAARGLMIYNTSHDRIEYWDGTQWYDISSAILVPTNGLRFNVASDTIKLGGLLTGNTQINLNSHGLNINTGTTSDKKYSVNDTVFFAYGRVVEIRPSKLAVNNDVFTIEGKDIKMNPNPSGKYILQSGSNTLTVQNSNVNVAGTLKYTDGKQGAGKVLVSREDGTAYWSTLRAEPTVEKGSIPALATSLSTNLDNPTNVTATNLTLFPGKWLIFAKLTTVSTATTGGQVWIYLRDGSSNAIAQFGAEINRGSANINAYPEIACMVDIKTPTTYSVFVASSITNTTIPSAGYLTGLLIDKYE